MPVASGVTSPDLHRGEKRTLLLVATVGALSALLGSAVGGYFANQATEKQVYGELQQSIRDDKKGAYLEYMASRANLRDLEFVLCNSLKSPQFPPPDFLNPKMDDYSDAVKRVHAAESALALVGSSEINDAAKVSAERHYEVQERIYDITGEPRPPDDQRIAIANEAKSMLRSLYDADMAVYEAAQRDLGFEER